MIAVKDSIHDYISLNPMATELIGTPAFRRLRHIKQLSTVRLVCPSVSRTWFEHSPGVCHLASHALSHLGVDGDRAAHVRAAIPLHDIGHGPYGHQIENLIRRWTDHDHNEIHHLLNETAVGDILADHGLSPGRVTDIIDGVGGLGQLVSGELDVDWTDYFICDIHHIGVPYGTIGRGHLVRELRYQDGELALTEGNVQTAEPLLLTRTLMNATVYRHHVSRITSVTLECASERLVDDGVPIESFVRMVDHDLPIALSRHVPDLDY